MQLKSFLVCVSLYGVLLLIQYNSDGQTLEEYKKAHTYTENTITSPIQKNTNSETKINALTQ